MPPKSVHLRGVAAGERGRMYIEGLQLSFKYHILQNHIHKNPYLEAHKPKINPSNTYTVNSIIDSTIIGYS